MPEIKRNFSKARMNKDLDERIVPNGEYRDAMNIQISTSDADAATGIGDVGVVQNLEGNEEVTETTTTTFGTKKSKIIASVADEGNDKTYYFTASPVPIDGILNGITPAEITSETHWVDSITEVGVDGQNEDLTRKFIFIDKFAITDTAANVFGDNTIPNGSSYISVLTVADASKYRVGMEIYGQQAGNTDILFPEGNQGARRIIKIDTTQNYLYLSNTTNFDFTNKVLKFIYPERVLEFDYYNGDSYSSLNLIPSASINILDNLLMWSDGKHEPKKINIDRCEAGTNIDGIINNGTTHTKLFVKDPITKELTDVRNIDIIFQTSPTMTDVSSDVKLENITTIKKSPHLPPEIEMSVSEREPALIEFPLTGYNFFEGDDIIQPGNEVMVPFPTGVDFRKGDIYTFNAANVNDPIVIRGEVIDVDGNEAEIKIIFADKDLNEQDNPSNWNVSLEIKRPLFESKFGRFGYRYKYEDNECSTFSPWSELAFLPGDFEYTPSKGFNEGMANTARKIVVKNFIPSIHVRPLDVKAIDILWKTTDNANVYIVKTLKRGVDYSEWDETNFQGEAACGSLTITSEMIYKVVEANQLLRAWDNVPRYARAQGISGNRILYGNYVQGYDVSQVINLEPSILSEVVPFPLPRKSLKSIRDYQLGVVIGDKFGRETPVLSSGYDLENNDITERVPSTIKVEKALSKFSNKFNVKPQWTNFGNNNSESAPADWMSYVKYYVKETSNEYYNLVLDRWYDAGDSNVWLAFNSADRNKVQENDYLILKNEHGSQAAIDEEARYKIIAIASEAPDYIKTSHKDFPLEVMAPKHVFGGGQLSNADPQTYTGNDAHPDNIIVDGNPSSESGFDRILLESAEPDEDGNTDYLNGLDFEGDALLRIVGKYKDTDGTFYHAHSPFRKITRVIKGGANGGEYGFGIRDPFNLSDVFMYQKIQQQLPDPSTLGTAVQSVDNYIDSGANSNLGRLTYNIQLRDQVVQNRPEFDGKFFVKIAKDNVLTNRVLGDSLGEYQVEGSYQIAHIRSRKENDVPPCAVLENEYEDFMEYEDGDWDTYVNADGASDANSLSTTITGANIADIFGQPSAAGETNSADTQEFWENWANHPDRTADIFLDNARARRGFGLNDDGDEDNPSGYEIFSSGFQGTLAVDDNGNQIESFVNGNGTNNGTIKHCDHVAFSNGGYDANFSYAQAIFSVIGPNGFNGSNAYFKSKMQQDGTLFRFTEDPNQHVYRVLIGRQFNPPDNDTSVSEIVTIESQNYGDFGEENGFNPDYQIRTSIVVRYKRLDASGNEIFEGINRETWDPLGVIKHNGLGSTGIEFVKRVSSQSLSEDSIQTSAACFETEPKEDLGLDIYYEASRAIPLKANNSNIIDYTGAYNSREKSSKLIVSTRPTSGNITLTGSPYVSDTVQSAIVVKRDVSGFDTDFLPTVTNGVFDGDYIAIGDYVSFEHKNGLVTRSKVQGHAKIDNASAAPNAVPSDTISLSCSVVIPNTISVPVGDVTTVPTAGMEVVSLTSNIVPKRTFVTDVNTDGITYSINLSQQLGFVGSSSFKFIETTGIFFIDKRFYKYAVDLAWNNCYSFGNGVESDRIRDDFNAPQIDNGIKASSVFLEYGQEEKTSSIIYSGIYNSTSSTNSLNQFNMAEKITKDLNTTYGSIQAIKARDNDVVVFTEDKVLKVMSSGKDVLFNAGGNAQLTSTNRVLGTSTPFAGDYGISKNPESLAVDAYRMYFTDKQRGAVLRLSGNGITPISDVGMKGYFREKLKYHTNILGTFDGVNNEYNLTLLRLNKFGESNTVSPSGDQTISFNEKSKGWISFKSFIPTSGVSIADRYYTTDGNKIYKHYVGKRSDGGRNHNIFYGTHTDSSIDVLFNESPSSIKSFKTVGYEGSQSRVLRFRTENHLGSGVEYTDGEFYNLYSIGSIDNVQISKRGWHVASIETNLQKGFVPEFIEKEGKWFNYIRGTGNQPADEAGSSISNRSTSFNIQGLGTILAAPVATGFTPQQETTAQATDADGNAYEQTPE